MTSHVRSDLSDARSMHDHQEESSSDLSSGRSYEDEAIPLGNPQHVVPVPLDVRKQREADRAIADQERDLQARVNDDGDRSATVATRFVRSLAQSAVLVIGGLALLFLWTQVIQAVGTIAVWSIGPWLGAMAILLLIGALLAWTIGRLALFWFRFRVNRPVIRDQLDDRKAARTDLGTRRAEAKVRLAKFVRDHPLDNGQRAFLNRCGVSQRDTEAMLRTGAHLLDGANRQDTASWIDTFASDYVGPLDRAAEKLIRDYAAVTAVKTAACPYALLDMCVVIYMGSGMLGSLCKVYRLRAGALDTLYLFALVLGQAMFAHRFEEGADEMATWVEGSMSGLTESVSDAAPDLLASLVGKITVRGSQGLANALLIHRIGRHACKLLRPIR